MTHRKKTEREPFVSPETQYLIEDVEQLVNQHIGRCLDDQPFRITLVDFTPALEEIDGHQSLPSGINRIADEIVSRVAPGSREFIGIDMSVSFPLEKDTIENNPLSVTLKWSDGIQCQLTLIDNRAIALVQNQAENEKTLSSIQLSGYKTDTYLKTIGLPESVWSDDFKDLLGDVYFSRDITIERHRADILDLTTTLEVSHSARYMTNDLGDKELVQELCLNIDHQSDDYTDGVYFPGRPVFRNMLRFERTEDATKWQYRGLYHGRLESGALIDDVVQLDPKLGIPRGKLLDKALHFLTQQESSI